MPFRARCVKFWTVPERGPPETITPQAPPLPATQSPFEAGTARTGIGAVSFRRLVVRVAPWCILPIVVPGVMSDIHCDQG